MDVLHLRNEWPYLFEPVGMFAHFGELTGISIRENFDSAITRPRILKWMEEEVSKNVRKIQQEFLKASSSVDNSNSEVAAMVCAVLSYLQEKEEFLYICVKVSSLKVTSI